VDELVVILGGKGIAVSVGSSLVMVAVIEGRYFWNA